MHVLPLHLWTHFNYEQSELWTNNEPDFDFDLFFDDLIAFRSDNYDLHGIYIPSAFDPSINFPPTH